MAEIKLAIEGKGAVAATEELFSQLNLQGEWQTVGENDRVVDLATVATIIGAVGGSMAIAEQLRQWYARWAAHAEKPLQKVVVVSSKGKRVQLSDVTPSELAQILDGVK